MEVVNILEGVISIFLGGCVGLEHSTVTSSIPRRNLSKASVQQLFFPLCEDPSSPGSHSPTSSPGLPCRCMSRRGLASCNIDLEVSVRKVQSGSRRQPHEICPIADFTCLDQKFLVRHKFY